MPRRRPFRADDLLRLRLVTDPQISPDGRRLAFVVAVPDNEADRQVQQVWVASIDGKGADGRGDGAPFASKGTSHSPRWSPDGKWLAFVSDQGGPGKAQLWVAPLDGGEPRRLTDATNAVAQPAWSPDSSRIAFVSRVEEGPPRPKNGPRVVRHLSERFDGFGWLDGRAHLFVVDVDGGQPRQLTEGEFDHAMPAWSPSGDELVVVSDREPGRRDRWGVGDLWIVPVATRTGKGKGKPGKARKITGSTGPVAHPAFSPDGRRIAYLGNDAGSEFWSAPAEVRMVAAAGGSAPVVLTGRDRAAGGRLLLDGRMLAWAPDGRSVYYVALDRGSVHVDRVTVDTHRVSTVVGGDRHVAAFDLSADGRTLAFTARYVDHLPDVRATSARRSGSEWVVHDPNSDLRAEVALAPAERRVHTAADGTEIESFVLRPTGAGRRTATPLVLDIHGGPHGFHPSTSTRMCSMAQAQVGAGYTVVMPNPRGSAGYGARFLSGCVGDWGGADFDDLMGAVDALIASGEADADRLYVNGYSYGGYMTSWTIGHTSRFRAAAVGAPVTDLLSMVGTTDIPHFSVHEAGGLPWERAEEYYKRSPVAYVADVTTPAMIFHHEGDLRCPIGQGEQLFALLRLAGKEAELVRYPGGFHGVGAPSHFADQAERILAWFAAHS